ncbi:hypothetical protein C4K22_3837 [Pseudomonas chlororaphis subsp. aurantiaca]|nr:hypothetical protein C4K22_3837 [Pseudomonas chlororaphis subsp. aurantiaca]AZD42917.1 hypothetical protein C4K21_3845 [Pseudomonas chlororaphis subsp. aurantiaca]AZD55434.1 hypothetical protein C4K19_3649 [Pseudomonas chlororaphis subsp. aurantiaca]
MAQKVFARFANTAVHPPSLPLGTCHGAVRHRSPLRLKETSMTSTASLSARADSTDQ